jgi:protocatechuate 3,4-dioxygenase alpha subunit
VTRIYFPDEQEANAADPVLASVEPARRHTLVATTATDQAASDGRPAFRFDIRLQGDGETVFFDV